jgi:hypothetical protein
MGGDIDDRKSTTGVVFALDENIITWQSQKQKVVALSSCEAKYIYSCNYYSMSRHLACSTDFRNHRCGVKKCVTLKVDNKSAILCARILY